MCGLFGVVGHPDAVQLTRLGLFALQSRGEESAGIAFPSSYGESIGDNPTLMRVGGMGLVSEAIPENLPTGFKAAIGHVRYSTAGPSCAENTQPIFSKNQQIALAHNGTITNMSDIRQKVGGYISSDSEAILRLYEKKQSLLEN